jgi:hypothetical protein
MPTINHNMTHKQFELEMLKWSLKNVPLIGKAVHSAVATAMYNGIVQRTPVLTGRARNNWFPTNGSPSEAAVEETAGVSQTGQPPTSQERARINTVTRKLKGVPLGSQTVFITNNQPYIQGLEDGRSPKSPPAAMVQGTIINTLDGLKVDIRSIPGLD